MHLLILKQLLIHHIHDNVYYIFAGLFYANSFSHNEWRSDMTRVTHYIHNNAGFRTFGFGLV